MLAFEAELKQEQYVSGHVIGPLAGSRRVVKGVAF
jgi:hypothetical protein